jgi:hypothetical protein
VEAQFGVGEESEVFARLRAIGPAVQSGREKASGIASAVLRTGRGVRPVLSQGRHQK